MNALCMIEAMINRLSNDWIILIARISITQIQVVKFLNMMTAIIMIIIYSLAFEELGLRNTIISLIS